TRTGEIFPVEISVSYIAEGKSEIAFSFVRDLSNRKQAEAALRDSEERFRQLAENIEDVFWMANVTPERELQLLYVSPAFEKVWGRDIPTLYSDQTPFIDFLHVQDQEVVQRLLCQVTDGRPGACEARLVRPNGVVR